MSLYPTLDFRGTSYQRGLHPRMKRDDRFGFPNIYEQADGIRPPHAFTPHRSIPKGPYDPESDDFIAIPKGKIVSLVGQACGNRPVADAEITAGPNDFDPRFGVYSERPTDQPPFRTGLDDTSLEITPDSDRDSTYTAFEFASPGNAYFVGSEIPAISVFANGGNNAEAEYSTADVGDTPLVGSFDGVDYDPVADGTPGAADTFDYAANKPVGMIFTDMLRDIDGKYISWKNQAPHTVLTDYEVRMPFVNLGHLATWFGTLDVAPTAVAALDSNADLVNTNPLYILSRMWGFSYAVSADCAAGNLAPGSAVYPDFHGNIIFDDTNIGTDLGGAAGTRDLDEQQVGKLLFIDHRMPKQLNQIVDTYPGSGAGAGTETGGLEYMLFQFISDLLLLAGVARSDMTIDMIRKLVLDYDVVGAGDETRTSTMFGWAYINLHVS